MDGKIDVIISTDVCERTIRELQAAIEILECESGISGVPFNGYRAAMSALRAAIWKEFDYMCADKASYSREEYSALIDSHRKRKHAQKEEKEDAKNPPCAK